MCTVQELRDEFDIDMRVLGIISSDRMLLSETAIDLEHWRERFERCAAIRCRLPVVFTPHTSLGGLFWRCGSSQQQVDNWFEVSASWIPADPLSWTSNCDDDDDELDTDWAL